MSNCCCDGLRYYPFTIRLLLEHYLKLQHTKIATPREITVPKNLDFTDPVYRKKLRLPLQKLGALPTRFRDSGATEDGGHSIRQGRTAFDDFAAVICNAQERFPECTAPLIHDKAA